MPTGTTGLWYPTEHMGLQFLELADRTELTLGRSHKCDVRLFDGDVSGKHAALEKVGRFWCISDLKSTNGTFVNGEPVEYKALADGDEIRLGASTRLRFADPATSNRTEPSEPTEKFDKPNLTPREHDVVVELCWPRFSGAKFPEPSSVQEIADALHLNVQTVKFHLENLYAKFRIAAGPHRRARLAEEAVRVGSVGHDDYRGRPRRP
ncbi:MAG TPA: FHA domain-containing protein [Acidimicrobiales bacterium]|nr:FHA domain-containing protein [Acidimicrobiales bacterium]